MAVVPKTDIERTAEDLIHVVCATDDLYAIMVCALLRSLAENHRSPETILFHIIDNGISRGNKKRILAANPSNTLHIEWVKMDVGLFDQFHPYASTVDLDTHYARFILPHLLGNQIKRAIYLDSDTLVLGDISSLWKVDLEGHVLGAVQDNTATVGDSWLIPNSTSLNLEPEDNYFNSGVLLIDLEQWRNQKYTHQLIDCTLTHWKHVRFFDQYAFNVVFYKKWKELPSSWNHVQVKPIQKHIDIIHYVAWDKPTAKTTTGLYHHVFYTYLDKATQGQWKPYYQLASHTGITNASQLPELLKQLHLIPLPFMLNYQGIVIEPSGGDISKLLVTSDSELQLIRLILLKIHSDFHLDESFKKELKQSGLISKIATQMHPYAENVSVMVKSAIQATSSLAKNTYSFIYIDLDEPLHTQKESIGNLIQLIHIGGLLCGTCIQQQPICPKDFDLFKFYDSYFDWTTADIRIHQDSNKPDRWFWYFIRTYDLNINNNP